LFAVTGGRPAGSRWAPEHRLDPPPPDVVLGPPEFRLYRSEPAGWSSAAAAHENNSRKEVWHGYPTTVDGEAPSPFQAAAAIADLASVVTHWGDAPLGFINVDITLTLARLPIGRELGLMALDRVEADGLAVGTALVHDRAGALGTSTACALANGDRVVNPRQRD
jgi:hypothetical protein